MERRKQDIGEGTELHEPEIKRAFTLEIKNKYLQGKPAAAEEELTSDEQMKRN